MTGAGAGTIDALLGEGRAFLKGASASPALDAELIAAALLKKPREFVLTHGNDPAPERVRDRFAQLLRERRRGVPLPYLTGTKEFCGRSFIVTPAVMVPRPETEALAAETIRLLGSGHGDWGMGHRHPTPRAPRPMAHGPWPIVADIGTGSGVLAITIAAGVPIARVVALDRSGSALQVARRNARRHHVLRRTTLIESDLLQKIPEALAPDLIVANLPYVSTDDLRHAGAHPDTRGLTFEPHRALDGGPDGLYVIRRFFAQFARFPHIRAALRHLLLEHSPSQRRRILELAHNALPDFTPAEVTPYVTRWTRR